MRREDRGFLPLTGVAGAALFRLLSERYHSAVAIHSALRGSFYEAQLRWGFVEVMHKVERARVSCEVALIDLEAHVAEHGC